MASATPRKRKPRARTAAGHMDHDQAAAVAHGVGPLLILGGPGTGKTHTLMQRIATLVEARGVPPAHILALTFTQGAAEALQDGCHKRLGPAVPPVGAMTFHALGFRILREASTAAGLPPDFEVATDADKIDLLRRGFDFSAIKARNYLARIALCKRRRAAATHDSQLDQVFTAYAAMLRDRGLVDFDDLVGCAAQVLADDAALCTLYRARYRYLCVDGYQDVDAQQHRLVQLLAGPDANLCILGDPDQAVDGQAGADVQFLLGLLQGNPRFTAVHLRQNHRARATIGAAAEAVRACACVGEATAPTILSPLPGSLTVHDANSARGEATFIADTIRGLMATPGAFRLADFAVLSRTAGQHALIEAALEQAGLPVQSRHDARLLDDPAAVRLVQRLAATPAATVRGRLDAARRALQNTAADDEDVHATAVARAALAPLATRAGRDLAAFSEVIRTSHFMDTWDARADRVALLTVHAARGMEFRVVFIVGCEAGIMPLAQPGGDAYDHPDERRLFYVGLSRAREQLFLIHAKRRTWHGRPRANLPSPFLAEIPSTLYETVEAVEAVETIEAVPSAAVVAREPAPRRQPPEQLRLW